VIETAEFKAGSSVTELDGNGRDGLASYCMTLDKLFFLDITVIKSHCYFPDRYPRHHRELS